jgi:hypothetical protein
LGGIGFLFTTNPQKHIKMIKDIRKKCGYENRELKFSSTDYSQVLVAIRLKDYFFQSENLYFKIIIKNNIFSNPDYFKDNFYKLDKKDMAYVSAYTELCKSINARKYDQKKKLLNLDHKPFRGNVILPMFLKKKDKTVTGVYRRDSSKRNKEGKFNGLSHLLQFTDFLTGTILSIADTKRKETTNEKQVKNIYRKNLLSRCVFMKEKLLRRENYYYPSFKKQKINVFYWKKNF